MRCLECLIKAILLKIAPDLSNQQLDDIIEIVISLPIEGIIATNTTIDRSNLKTDKSIVSSMELVVAVFQ